MVDLFQSLTQKDPAFLHIVAGLWGVLPEGDEAAELPARELSQSMLKHERVEGMVSWLPGDARAALEELAKNNGEMPWAIFARQFGNIREMGAARRERLQPHLQPASTAEVLWYRAMITRAFLDTPNGPQEFACIPSDLLLLLPEPQVEIAIAPGRAATAAERNIVYLATDAILDQSCTLLAAKRLGLQFASPEFVAGSWDLESPRLPRPEVLYAMLQAAGLFETATSLPHPENSRHFLETPRNKALAQLTRSWMHTPDFNDLRMVPGLEFEGDWRNDPLRARYAILDTLAEVPRNTWWSLAAFVERIKEAQPDFQRPAGDYDSWYVRKKESSEFLRGFEQWDEVEGALVRFIVTGPLHWLGVLDLAAPGDHHPAAAFRFSRWADALMNGAPPEDMETEDDNLLVSSDARLRAPRLVQRIARYQLARMCTWEAANEDAFSYRITPASLERAKAQGLRVSHLVTLLRRSALAVAPGLVKALERWDTNGSEAHMERALILRVRSPEILQALRGSRAARFLGQPLGPTAIIVKASARDKVLAVLAELGFLGESEPQEMKPPE
jgi:hypothetical protein